MEYKHRFYLIFSLLVILQTFVSCEVIYFDKPQPAKAKDLNAIPQVLHGDWFNDNSSMHIDAKSFQFKELKKDSVVSMMKFALSDSLKIRKAKDFYVASIRKKNNRWELFILQCDDQNDIHIYYPSLEKLIKLKNIQVDTSNVEQNSTTEYYLETRLKSKEIKDIVEEKSLMMILSGDSIINSHSGSFESN